MKLQKLLKKLALPVFALVVVGMLAACSNPSGGSSGSGGDSGSGGGAGTQKQNENGNNGGGNNGGNGSGISDSTTPVTETPLVSANDVTVSATKIELSDGKWSYKEISEQDETYKSIKEAEMTVSENGTVVKYTAMKKTGSGTIPSDATSAQIAEAKAQGMVIDGNKYSMTKVYSDEELQEKSEHAIYNFVSSDNYLFENIKTNSDKTKYSWTIKDTYTDYKTEEDAKNNVNGVEVTKTIQASLVKISGASTTTPSSGETGENEVQVTIPEGKYALIYDGVVFKITKAEDASYYTEYSSVQDNKIIFTDTGFQQYLTHLSEQMSVPVFAIVVYKNETKMFLTQDMFTSYGNKLSSSDYTLKGKNHIIVLTDSGWNKFNTPPETSQDDSGSVSGESETIPSDATGIVVGKGDYILTYKNYVLFSGITEDTIKKLEESEYAQKIAYTIKDKTMVLSAEGLATCMDKLGANGDKIYAIIIYKGGMIAALDETGYKDCDKELTSKKDCTIVDDDNLIVVLTDSGYEKIKKILKLTESEEDEENGTIGTPTGIDSDKSYTIIIGDDSEPMKGSEFIQMAAVYEFDKNDYTIEEDTIKVTASGLEKMKEAEKNSYKIVYDEVDFGFMPKKGFDYIAEMVSLSKSEYSVDEDSKTITLTASGYAKVKDIIKPYNPTGEATSHSSESSGTSYKGKIESDKVYKVYDNKEYNGTEFKGAAFIEMVKEHSWQEGKDYYVDNENYTITFQANSGSSEGSGSSEIPKND